MSDAESARMRKVAGLAILLVTIAACTTAPPAAQPSAEPTVASTPVPVATEEPPRQTPSPIPPAQPAPPLMAPTPDVRVSAESLIIAAPTALTAVPISAHPELGDSVTGWYVEYLRTMDEYRHGGTDAHFLNQVAAGPYREILHAALRSGDAATRTFVADGTRVDRVYEKPWGSIEYLDVVAGVIDRGTGDSGDRYALRLRLQSVPQLGFRVLDKWDDVGGRWINGTAPRYGAAALAAEATTPMNPVGWHLQNESYVKGGLTTRFSGPGEPTPYTRAWQAYLERLRADFGKSFIARRFEDVSARLMRFEPASFLGDGIVTARVDGRVVVTGVDGTERAQPMTRTVKFLRRVSFSEQVPFTWQVVDEQLVAGIWASGGDLALDKTDRAFG